MDPFNRYEFLILFLECVQLIAFKFASVEKIERLGLGSVYMKEGLKVFNACVDWER
jgi:hypothetical protein